MIVHSRPCLEERSAPNVLGLITGPQNGIDSGIMDMPQNVAAHRRPETRTPDSARAAGLNWQSRTPETLNVKTVGNAYAAYKR